MTESSRGQPGQHGLVRALLALAMAAVVALVATLGLLPAGRAGEPEEAPLHALGSLPLRFEPNVGQSAPEVEFLARGEGYALFLTQGEAVLRLRRAGVQADGAESTAPAVLRWSLAGSNPSSPVTPLSRLPGSVNYFKGNNPESWRTGVPTYARVMYRDVYPGVDLVYYGNQGELEYDFIVAPGADPGLISLRFEGAEATRLDAQGNLRLNVASGHVELRTPLVYQEMAGKRHEVAGSYVLKGDGEVGFQVLAYDSRKPLVIDPALAYSSYLGGGVGQERGLDIAVDSQGLAYVTGWTLSTDFPTKGGGGADNTINGGRDAFVSVFDPSQSGATATILPRASPCPPTASLTWSATRAPPTFPPRSALTSRRRLSSPSVLSTCS